MKLTDEMRREASAIYDENVRPGSSVMGAWRAIELAIFAGYRMGQEAMRERAAKTCEALAGANAGHTVSSFVCGTEAESCADLICSLPVEE